MGKYPDWTDGQLAIAERMFADGSNWREMDRALGKGRNVVKAFFIRMGPTPAIRAENLKRANDRRDKRIEGPAGGGRISAFVRSVTVPSDVLAERDRTFSRPLSLSMSICGDPPPGRSALDRMARS